MGEHCSLFHHGEVPKNFIKDPNEKPALIVERESCLELHFKDRVEFWGCDNKIQGWSEVELVE